MKRSDSLNALFVLVSFILNTYYLYMFVEALTDKSPYVQLEHNWSDEDSYVPADEEQETQKPIPKWVKSIDTDIDLDVLPDRAWFAGNPFYLGLDV